MPSPAHFTSNDCDDSDDEPNEKKGMKADPKNSDSDSNDGHKNEEGRAR